MGELLDLTGNNLNLVIEGAVLKCGSKDQPNQNTIGPTATPPGYGKTQTPLTGLGRT